LVDKFEMKHYTALQNGLTEYSIRLRSIKYTNAQKALHLSYRDMELYGIGWIMTYSSQNL